MGFWRDWLAERELQKRAAVFARTQGGDPSEGDVRWLAETAAGGDADHARWELRYARWVLAIITAEHDAMDDRTPAAVSRAVMHALRHDPGVASDRLSAAERQFSARLRRYREALRDRVSGSPDERIARVLLEFAGDSAPATRAVSIRASAILGGYRTDANAELRRAFGETSLPDSVPPSALKTTRR